VRTRLQVANPEYAALTAVEPLTLPRVQQTLDDQTTLLSYFVTPDRTLAWVVTRAGFEAVELPVAARALAGAIRDFRDFSVLSDRPPASLGTLYDWLIAPLRQHLKTPGLAVVPHAMLHYLPFAALSEGQRYLSDDFGLYAMPSASAMQVVRQKRKSGPLAILALAQARAPGLPPLAFADDEARAVAALFGAQAITGAAATETAFSSAAAAAGIIHLAAHGQLNQKRPLFSRLVLAADDRNDGRLEVHEVYGLDLAKADLVVLSACETELGARSEGDDVVGLNRAFIYAGTPSVLASLCRRRRGHATADVGLLQPPQGRPEQVRGPAPGADRTPQGLPPPLLLGAICSDRRPWSRVASRHNRANTEPGTRANVGVDGRSHTGGNRFTGPAARPHPTPGSTAQQPDPHYMATRTKESAARW